MTSENFMFPIDAVRSTAKGIISVHGFQMINDDSISGLIKAKIPEDGKYKYREVHFLITKGNDTETKVRILCIKKILGFANPFVSFAADENVLLDELKTGVKNISK